MFETFEPESKAYISIHREDCSQLRKHGGIPASGRKLYQRHRTYQEARQYAESKEIPIKVCSRCSPQHR